MSIASELIYSNPETAHSGCVSITLIRLLIHLVFPYGQFRMQWTRVIRHGSQLISMTLIHALHKWLLLGQLQSSLGFINTLAT